MYKVGLIALGVLVSCMSVAAENGLKDPTQPLSWSPAKSTQVTSAIAKKTTFRLKSVFVSGSTKVARINGHKVREGDWVQGAKVSRIYKDRVVLQVKGKSETIRLAGKVKIRKSIRK